MAPNELIEPTSAAAGSDRGALGGPVPTLSHSSSLKRVIELWHGRNNSQSNANAAAAGGERTATPDSVSLSASGGGGGGGSGDGAQALLSGSESQRHLREQDGGGGKELLAIVNPSAESLCQALAYGAEWTAGRNGSSGRWGRRTKRKAPGPDGAGEEEDAGAGGDDEEQEEEEDDDGAGPLPLGALPAAALDDLPHNRWLALPLVKAAPAPAAATTATYEIDMPLIPGPAVVFFYSPYGRLRLRGVLRDDGAEPILEMD